MHDASIYSLHIVALYALYSYSASNTVRSSVVLRNGDPLHIRKHEWAGVCGSAFPRPGKWGKLFLFCFPHGRELCIFLRFSLPSKAGAQCPGTLIGRMAYWCLCGTVPQLWMPGGVKQKEFWEWHIGCARALPEPRSGLTAANLGNMPKQAYVRFLLGSGDPCAAIFSLGSVLRFLVFPRVSSCFLVVLVFSLKNYAL